MTQNLFQLIAQDKPHCLFLAQAHEHVVQRRLPIAERLLTNAVDRRAIELKPRIFAHCHILLGNVWEQCGHEHQVPRLYYGALTIYDNELGFEHPAVQELATFMMLHHYW